MLCMEDLLVGLRDKLTFVQIFLDVSNFPLRFTTQFACWSKLVSLIIWNQFLTWNFRLGFTNWIALPFYSFVGIKLMFSIFMVFFNVFRVLSCFICLGWFMENIKNRKFTIWGVLSQLWNSDLLLGKRLTRMFSQTGECALPLCSPVLA